ncbi:hypothetical protein [Flavobacterium alkalisoli]|uniref:hypothetical protein n=1 Tax=Flavobacterium alkalisoli TaxID=2602769 RepID=UPI001F0E18B6|nr:hypothetical protein [Flavobacterium alkalisoli]
MSYLEFLLKSKNAHGVHSPFVFDLVTDGFYFGKKVKISNNSVSNQALTTLFKTINHFRSFKLAIMGENAHDMTEAIREAGEKTKTQIWFFSPLASVPGGLDMSVICGHDKHTILPVFNKLLDNVAEKNIFVLTDPHATPEREAAWEAIKKDPNVTVTVDTYHLGLIFFRKGQAKQHFNIRPYRSFALDLVLGVRNLWGLLA